VLVRLPLGDGLTFRHQNAASKTHMFRRRSASCQFHGTIFEFGNFSEWIQHGIRQHIRRRLIEAERNKNDAAWHSIVGSCVE